MFASSWLRISEQVFPACCLLFMVLSSNLFDMNTLYLITVIFLSIRASNLNACDRALFSGSNDLSPLNLNSKHCKTGFAIFISVLSLFSVHICTELCGHSWGKYLYLGYECIFLVYVSISACHIMHYCTGQKC